MVIWKGNKHMLTTWNDTWDDPPSRGYLSFPYLRDFQQNQLVQASIKRSLFNLQASFQTCSFSMSPASTNGLGWCFGIRIGVPLSNNPFHEGILRIPNHRAPSPQLTISWRLIASPQFKLVRWHSRSLSMYDFWLSVFGRYMSRNNALDCKQNTELTSVVQQVNCC